MDETKINGMLAALEQQRNAAMNQVVQLAAELAVLQEKVKELEKPKEEAVKEPTN